jgi:hypothetical protein
VADTLRALQADADALKSSYESDRATKATLELFKNEGVAPDAPQRVARFFKGRKGKPA